MKYKKENDFEGLHIVTFAFKKLPKRVEEQFELLFYKIEDYKNDFVNFINNRNRKTKLCNYRPRLLLFK